MWFDPSPLSRFTDAKSWQRGRSLYGASKVLSWGGVPTQNGWELRGRVQGTQRQPYDVEVNLVFKPKGEPIAWSSECSCPVGSQCKHAVALLFMAASQGEKRLGAAAVLGGAEGGQAGGVTVPALTRKQDEQARLQAAADMEAKQARLKTERSLSQWLDRLDRLTPAPEPRQTNQVASRVDRPVYVLETFDTDGCTVLRLTCAVVFAKVKGGWSKYKEVSLGQAQNHPAWAQHDRELLQWLRTLNSGHGYVYSYSHSFTSSLGLDVSGPLAAMVLERVAATGFLTLGNSGRDVEKFVRWGSDIDLAWQWREQLDKATQESSWQLRPLLPHPTVRLCGSDPLFYIDNRSMTCGLVRLPDGMSPQKVHALLQAPAMPVWAIEKHQAGLLRSLGQVPLPPVLPAVETIAGVQPLWRLHLSPVPPDLVSEVGLVTAQLDFDYQGLQGWWQGEPVTVMVGRNGQRVLLTRERASERNAIQQLAALGLEDQDEGMFGLSPEQSQLRWLQWADEKFAPLVKAGFVVTTDASLLNWVRHADGLVVDMQPEGDDEAISPWFDLSLGLEIGGQRINVLPWLPQWLHMLGNSPLDEVTGERTLPPFVYMPAPDVPGFIRVPTDTLKPWIGALLELLGERHGDFANGSLRLSRLEALRASAALGEGVEWAGADALRELSQQLSGRAELPEVPLPAGLQAELRPYQHQGLNWLQFLRTHGLAGILADDMGLGKTLQTLAHIQCEKEAGRLTQPALIVAPVSLLSNWQREAQRFCPGLRSLVLHGAGRHDLAVNMSEVDMVIAPYSLLQRDRERWLATDWHLVVLDEAQNIKNASTLAAQVVMELSARHRLCLSGTPMENHLGEIWSLFHFLMPGFLGSQQRFRDVFRTPIEKHADGQRLAQLRSRITPFMLRRTKALVAGELPPKVETTMRVELTGKQADLYETIRLGMEKTVRDALATQGMARSQIAILDALLKLRQVCCDPGLVPLEAARKVKASAKMEQLMEVLPEMLAEGRRVLLFSQFTSMLMLIEAELKKRKLSWVKLTGQTQKRDEVIQRFTSGEVPLFLISLKAGGVGLNLPQADTVIHYDPWWNPAVENQATDRAHRIGQTQSVWVIKLVAQGTIEERILALQERKAALANDVYSGSASRKQPLFSEDDLEELLKPLGSGWS